MSEFVLQRYEDISGISGLGLVAHGCEFPDGSVALRWPGEHPSTAVWPDIRDVEAIHGHEGTTVVVYQDPARLLKSYQLVMPYVLTARPQNMPLKIDAHPDHPDRLRVIVLTYPAWRWWVALLDGSTDTALHEEVNGETEHRWVSADGNVWCVYYSPIASEQDPIHDPRD